jgi:tetratricopeptide (TPR) repeat protein
MKNIAIILIVFFVLSQKKCFAQFSKQLDSLYDTFNRSTSDSEKVMALGTLADYYYIFNLNRQADSLLHQQLLVAELSNNSNLILKALFGDAILNIGTSETSESFDKTIMFIQKGIDYAKSTKQYNYLALGYSRMADILRRRGEYDKALANSVFALSALQNVTIDSVKAVIFISMGDVYLDRNEAVSAFANYNNAFDIAVKINSVVLQSKIHHSISEMYKKLGDDNIALAELNESLKLNKKYGNAIGMMKDYYGLARLTMEKFYIERTIELADSLHLYIYLLNGRRSMLEYYYVVEKNTQKALQYLENEQYVKLSFLNKGYGKFFEVKGNIYYYSGHPDSALHYYKIAEPEITKKFDRKASQVILVQIAECYADTGNASMAITYYVKALKLSKQMNDANSIASISKRLSELYEKQNDFKNALTYSRQANVYEDSLKNLSKDRDIALLEVDRENKKHQQELILQQRIENNRRNIQYMAITIIILIIFFGMLVIGSITASVLTIKLLGYFFFISLFEFIILLVHDVILTNFVHNQPVKLWIMKIVLIALLVPIQQYLEQRLIKRLASRKLLKAGKKFSIKKWRFKINKTSTVREESLGKDSAML